MEYAENIREIGITVGRFWNRIVSWTVQVDQVETLATAKRLNASPFSMREEKIIVSKAHSKSHLRHIWDSKLRVFKSESFCNLQQYRLCYSGHQLYNLHSSFPDMETNLQNCIKSSCAKEFRIFMEIKVTIVKTIVAFI